MATEPPTHTLRCELTTAELYAILGYSWYHAATTIGTTCAAHMRVAQSCKNALAEAGEPSQNVEDKLADMMRELGITPSA